MKPSAGFEHDLPPVRGTGASSTPYYLTIFEQLSNCVDRHECLNVSSILRERAAELSPQRGSFGEAELVAAHTELISKELYHVVSQSPQPLEWAPTSAYRLMCSARDQDGGGASHTPFLQPSKTFAGTQIPCYRVHDELARVAEQPARRFIKPDMWEYRQATMREFLTPARMLAAQAVVDDLLHSDSNPATGGASTLKAVHGFQQLEEDRRSFLHYGDGLMLHAWRVPSEARRLVSTAQKVWQTLFEYSLHPYGTLVAALLFVKGIAVTFTQLPPLLPSAQSLPTDHDLHSCTSSAVAKCLAALIGSSYYTRRAAGAAGDATLAQLPNTKLQVGADGRYYFMYPMSLGIYPEEVGRVPRLPAQGGNYLQTPLRPEVYYSVLPKGTSFRYSYDELQRNMRDGPCSVAAEAILRVAQPKLTDMVTQQLVTATMHSLGVNMRYLHVVYQQLVKLAKTGPPNELMTVAMDAIIAEMLCRTIKTILRAELTAASLSPSTVAAAGLTTPTTHEDNSSQRINRFMEWVSSGDKGIWDDQVMVVLRRKFVECPDTFHVPFHVKYFRIFMWYLTPKLGATYDAKLNAFVKVTQATSPNSSFFFVPEVVKMHLSLKQSDEAAQQLAMWWSAVEQLPYSTPTAWMERCLRMQRIAYICVIMKHTSRQQFLDACQATILDAKQSRFRLHHVLTALFQMMLVDEVDVGTMVTQPLFIAISSVVKEMIGGSEGEKVLFAHETDASDGSASALLGFTALASPRSPCVALRPQNVHFVGYVLRSLVSTVPTKGATSTLPLELIQHARSAAVLQLFHNIHQVLGGQVSGREAAIPSVVTVVDVACNRQLLEDLSSVDDVFVQCAVMASLARHAAPPQGTLRLEACNPAPMYPSEYVSALRRVMLHATSTQSAALTAPQLAMLHNASWISLCAVGQSPLWSETKSAGLGLRAPSQLSRLCTPPNVLYNDPHVVCVLMLCVATALRRWTSGGNAVDMSSHIRVVLEAYDLVAGAFPSPSSVRPSTVTAAFAASEDIEDAVRPAPLSNALGGILDDVLIRRGEWALSKLVGEFLQWNRAVVQRPAVAAALTRLQHHEQRATSIQKLFRRATGRGLYADGAEVGSPEWHASLLRNLQQLHSSSLLFAAGLSFQGQLQHWRIRRQAVSEEETIFRWSVMLDEEIALREFNSMLTLAADAKQFETLVTSEWSARYDIELHHLMEEAELSCLLVESNEAAEWTDLASAALAAEGLSNAIRTFEAQRADIELDEAAEWLLQVVHLFYAAELLEHHAQLGNTASQEATMLTLQRGEVVARLAVYFDEINDAVDSLLCSAWVQVAMRALQSASNTAQTGTILKSIEEDEALRRSKLEEELLIDCTSSVCYLWVEGYVDQLSQVFLKDAYYSEEGVWESFIVPLYATLLAEAQTGVSHDWGSLQNAIGCAALSSLEDDDEPQLRDTVVSDYHSEVITRLLPEWEALHRGSIAAQEAGTRSNFEGDVAISQQIFAPEADARLELLSLEHSLFVNDLFVSFAVSALHNGVELRWCQSVESLHRSLQEGTAACEYLNVFASMFGGNDNLLSYVYALEHSARTHLFEACALHHQSVATKREWIRTRLDIVAIAADSWRSAVESEAFASFGVIQKAMHQQLSHTRIQSLIAAESSARSVMHRIVGNEQLQLLVELHEEYLDSIFDEQSGVAASRLVVTQEALHRSALQVQYLQHYKSTILARCAIERRQCWEQQCTRERAVLNKSFVIEKSRIKRDEVIRGEESTERDALQKLEALMKSITMNLFNARPKVFLRPSEKAFHQAKRKQQQRRQHQQEQSQQNHHQVQPVVSSGNLSSPLRTIPEAPHSNNETEIAPPALTPRRANAIMTACIEALEDREQVHRMHTDGTESQLWAVLEDAVQHLFSRHEELVDYEALEEILRLPSTPMWDDESDVNPFAVKPHHDIVSPSASDVAVPADSNAQLLRSPPSVDLETDLHDYVPLRFSSKIPHTTAPETTRQQLRALLAEESAQREGIVELEHQLALILAADDKEIRDTFHDPTYLYYRWCIPQLPWTYPFVSAECVGGAAERIPPHVVAAHRRVVTSLRLMTQKLIAAKTILDRNERTAFRMLVQKEALDRGEALQRQNVPHEGRASHLRARVKGVLPEPPKGGLWRGDKLQPLQPSSTTAAASRNLPLHSSSVVHSYSGVPTGRGSSYQLPPMASSLQGLPPLPSTASLSGLGGQLWGGGKSEADLLLEDWDIRAYKCIFTLENLDDVAPAQQRLRMRMEEVEQSAWVDLVKCVRKAMSEEAASSGSARAADHLNASSSAVLLGSPSSAVAATGTMPVRGDWVHQRSPAATGSGQLVAAVGGRSVSPKELFLPAALELNPVDPKGKRRQKPQ